MNEIDEMKETDFTSFLRPVRIHESHNPMKWSFQPQWSFELTDRHTIDDEWQQEQEQMMMIIARICYDKRWQEQCTIDEDDTTDKDFNDDEAFENKDNNNECDDEWTKSLKLNVMLLQTKSLCAFWWIFQVQFLNFLQL